MMLPVPVKIQEMHAKFRLYAVKIKAAGLLVDGFQLACFETLVRLVAPVSKLAIR